MPAESSSTISPLRMAAARPLRAANACGVENCCSRICCSDRRAPVRRRVAPILVEARPNARWSLDFVHGISFTTNLRMDSASGCST